MIAVVSGHEKSGKSTFAMTFPAPVKIIELDVGGVERAIWRFRGKIDKERDVVSIIPNEILNPDRSELVAWRDMQAQYLAWMQDESVATVVIDSGTLLWSLCHGAYLQQLNVNAERKRLSLMPVEYREPNSRMRSLLAAARQYKKNLVIPHHLREVRVDVPGKDGTTVSMVTGEFETSGFKEMGYLSDVVIRTSIDQKAKEAKDYFKAEMQLCGLAMTLMGMQIVPEPTYDSMLRLIRIARGEGEDWMP